MSDGWRPGEDVVASARVARFAAAQGAACFDDLLRRSVAEPDWFWPAAIEHLGLPFSTSWETVLDETDGPAWARWFVGAETNAAAMCLDRWLAADGHRPAVRWHGEDGAVRGWSYRVLHEQAEGLAALLRSRGVVRGDRIAIHLPMIPEAVAGLLAIAKLGAVGVPLFSGFGAAALRVRIEDAACVAVLTCDGTLRRCVPFEMADPLLEATANLPTVRTVVVVPRLGTPPTTGLATTADVVGWPQPLAGGSTTVAVPADHELLLAYTSGTTGVPKGAVHTHGGLPVKVAAEGAFQHDIGPADTLLWFSDMGWIMGPYQIVAALANGGCLCLVEGTPDHPGPDRLWRVVEESQVTVLGLSPTLVRSLMPHGQRLVRDRDLTSLRILGSTGEPWNEAPWHWYFDVVGGRRCPVINMSGGTEVGGALLSAHPVQPIAPGALVGPSLGIAADVFDDSGRPLRGRVGELVCTRSWPGMTKGLHRDPVRYEQTYWSRWPGVWVQGDWASIDADGQWFLHGRSDDTIMIAGKRLGPIEPESALVSHPAVAEAAAVGVPNEVKGEELAVFVVLAPGKSASAELMRSLRSHVASELGSSFRPAQVHVVDQLPKTRSNKVLRRALRALLTGDDPGDLASMDDPEVIDQLRRQVEERNGT